MMLLHRWLYWFRGRSSSGDPFEGVCETTVEWAGVVRSVASSLVARTVTGSLPLRTATAALHVRSVTATFPVRTVTHDCE